MLELFWIDVSDISDDDDESDFDITMVLSDSGTDDGEESDDDSPNDQTSNNLPGVAVGCKRWMSNDTDFSRFSFTAQNAGPNFQQVPQTELEYFQSFMMDELILIQTGLIKFLSNCIWTTRIKS